MPNASSYKDEHLLVGTEYIKSKVTRKCDVGQVDFRRGGVHNTIDLLEEKEFQQRKQRVVLGVVVDTRCGRRG